MKEKTLMKILWAVMTPFIIYSLYWTWPIVWDGIIYPLFFGPSFRGYIDK